MYTRFGAYLGAAPPPLAACLYGAMEQLQRGEIDVHTVTLGLEPGYSVWTCEVIIVAQIYDDTLGLIDVLETPDESV